MRANEMQRYKSILAAMAKAAIEASIEDFRKLNI